jgi:pentatricopeptide repeat protein
MLGKAQEVFNALPSQDSVAWNSLIMGYADHGYDTEALKCLSEMQDKGLSPDAITYACALKSCSNIGSVEKGIQIHTEAEKQGLVNNNVVLNTALVDMYAKCGMLEKAREVFDELPTRDSISWTALIAGYAYHGFSIEALNCFALMQDEGFSPSAITFSCVLKACGNIGSFEKGEEIHAEILRQDGLLQDNVMLGTALIDMYAKCGMLAHAQDTFDGLPAQDVITWNSLINGYAQLGEVESVLQIFGKMRQAGVVPNMATFNIMLSACSHAGLVDEGQMCFDCMNNVYNLTPTSEHYSCMVDLFSRAGHFDKAMAMIKKVPDEDSLELWLALLGACKKWRNVELGKHVFEHLIRRDGSNVSAYICMSNIYAEAGMQEEANQIEALRLRNRTKQVQQLCWLADEKGKLFSFSRGRNKIYPQSKQVYLKLETAGRAEPSSLSTLISE